MSIINEHIEEFYIPQGGYGLNSRSEANFLDDEGNLPLITSPMSSVVQPARSSVFEEQSIHICYPRGIDINYSPKYFKSVSIQEFYKDFLSPESEILEKNPENDYDFQVKVCIDTANGNIPQLHEAIRISKKLYGDHIQIMAGNVSSFDAFKYLCLTGCDYIRVGIGGGSACTTTVHTGVGQSSLKSLIESCYRWINSSAYNREIKPKIVADGISSFIDSHKLHRNGYAAINLLLYAGADYVMLGNIFSRAIDSAAKKKIIGEADGMVAIYRGMSTKEEQSVYKVGDIKHSEGKTIYLPVEYSISEWVNGKEGESHDDFPGFVNALKSAMAYVGANNLKDFKINQYG